MVITHNLQAMNGNRQLNMNVKSKRSSMEKLSSGYQVNRAADDAAGLSISEKMRNQIRGLDQSVKNAEDGISFIHTADGAMQSVQNILGRVRELAVQAANDVNASDDREAIQSEIDEISAQIDDIIEKTKFNGKNVFSHQNVVKIDAGAPQSTRTDIPLFETSDGKKFDIGESGKYIHAQKIDKALMDKDPSLGTSDDTLYLQVGANAGEDMMIERYSLSSWSLFTGIMDVSNHVKAVDAIAKADVASRMVSEVRSHYGAIENRLEYTINNLKNYSENLTYAESSIRDTDMATEMAKYSKDSILEQAAQAMLSQTNQSTQGVLSLIQG